MDPFQTAREIFLKGGTDKWGIPVRNSRNGTLTLGSQADSKWSFKFPAAPPMTPPTRVFIPGWIFEPTGQAQRARLVFNGLADMEFLAHHHPKCGRKHKIITRLDQTLVDIPCCND